MSLRLAIVVSHPIQHFAPWHRELAKLKNIDLKVFFCCDWGTKPYFDRDFATEVEWDIPLLTGYASEFLPIRNRPTALNYSQVDNPEVAAALDRFDPHVVKVFGYNYKTNWRVQSWASRHRKPLLLYSDSSTLSSTRWYMKYVKQVVVNRFYSRVDGALFVGDNNRAYHQRYGLPADRLFSGSLPVDRTQLLNGAHNIQETRQLLRKKLSIPANAFVVLLCGKYAPHKRPLDLVKCAWILKNRGLPIWSLLVGEGPLRREMEQYCGRQGVDNVVLTGFINQASISSYYAASDVIAVTSSVDNHPLVISEAASFGLPAIVSDRVGCIGPSDSARPGYNAITYSCGNLSELTDVIERLYRDENLYRAMSKAAINVSETQDVLVAAKQLANAAESLHAMGPRRSIKHSKVSE